MGSASIVAQLAQHDLVDAYQLVINPIVLGTGQVDVHRPRAALCLEAEQYPSVQERQRGRVLPARLAPDVSPLWS